MFIETTKTVDSETNDFAGSKNNVAQKTGLTKDGEWAIRRGDLSSYGKFDSGTITMLAPNGRGTAFLSLPGAVSLVPKPVIDGWRELSDSVRSWLGSAVRDISFWFERVLVFLSQSTLYPKAKLVGYLGF